MVGSAGRSEDTLKNIYMNVEYIEQRIAVPISMIALLSKNFAPATDLGHLRMIKIHHYCPHSGVSWMIRRHSKIQDAHFGYREYIEASLYR